MAPIRIEVVSADDCSNLQARAYAEYRLFAALARHAPQVRSARVTLGRENRNGARDTVICNVIVALTGEDSVGTNASAAHACAAINQAVARITQLLHQRVTGST